MTDPASADGRGAYLARLGDCTSCHTKPGGAPFAGGYEVRSPFGIIYGTNITPDPDYGIGRYSLKDFDRAVRQGIAKDGHRLYPAMPFPSFTKMTDDDLSALYDYFMHEVAPVHAPSPQTHLPFPFSLRWGLWAWDWAFTREGPYHPHGDRDAQWNRGAYLVQSFGHCGACHTPRGLAYEERGMSESSPLFLTGGALDSWYAPNLTGNPDTGLGSWSQDDIAAFLQTGHAAGSIAFGSMKEVVEHSGQYMSQDDRDAIARYVKSLASRGSTSSYNAASAAPDPFEPPGAGLYATFCARCHQSDGSGKFPETPKLAGNPIIVAGDPTSVIRIVLEGSQSPQTQDDPKPDKMPGFARRFSSGEVAQVVTFIRRSWGNQASAISEREVEKLRENLQQR